MTVCNMASKSDARVMLCLSCLCDRYNLPSHLPIAYIFNVYSLHAIVLICATAKMQDGKCWQRAGKAQMGTQRPPQAT